MPTHRHLRARFNSGDFARGAHCPGSEHLSRWTCLEADTRRRHRGSCRSLVAACEPPIFGSDGTANTRGTHHTTSYGSKAASGKNQLAHDAHCNTLRLQVVHHTCPPLLFAFQHVNERMAQHPWRNSTIAIPQLCILPFWSMGRNGPGKPSFFHFFIQSKLCGAIFAIADFV